MEPDIGFELTKNLANSRSTLLQAKMVGRYSRRPKFSAAEIFRSPF